MSDHIIISIFLRGGMDGLSYLVPAADPDYRAGRPELAVPASAVRPLDATFGLHPSAEPLGDLWDAGQLAFVPASGSTDPTRSHFEAMAIIEAGLGGEVGGVGGWLGRYVAETRATEPAVLPAVGIGAFVPLTLHGAVDAAGISDLEAFRLGGIGSVRISTGLERALTEVVAGGDDPVAHTGRAVHATLDRFATAGLTGAPTPAEFGPSRFGQDLWQVVQLIEADIGVTAFTVDVGGWDHHDDLGTVDAGRMQELLGTTTRALRAGWDRLADHHDRITVVMMSEFGRRVGENANGGTDHGHGGVMTVLGGAIAGGVHGPWSGLAPDVLDRGDVPVLTDHRAVLAEIVDRCAGRPDVVAAVFPGWTTDPGAYVGVAA